MLVAPLLTACVAAVVSGGELMTYARLTDDEANQWRGIDGVQILAETEFDGPGTADRLYEALFADAGMIDE